MASSFSSTAFRDSLCAAVSPAEPWALPGVLRSRHQLVEFLGRPDYAYNGKAPPGKIVRLRDRHEVLKEFPVKFSRGVRVIIPAVRHDEKVRDARRQGQFGSGFRECRLYQTAPRHREF